MLTDVRFSLRQQRVISRDYDNMINAHHGATDLMKKLDAMGLMIPESAIKIEFGTPSTALAYLSFSELQAHVDWNFEE